MQFLKLGENVIINLEQVILVNFNASENRALIFLADNKSVEVYTPEDYQKLMAEIDPVIEPPDPPDGWVPFEVEPDPKAYDRPAVAV